MAVGIIISNKTRLMIRVLHALEGRFPDVEECTQVGGGIQETRPEFRRKYKPRVQVRFHPDGVRVALIMSSAAKTRFDAWLANIAARRAASGAVSADEAEVEAFPLEALLDASWDAVPTSVA